MNGEDKGLMAKVGNRYSGGSNGGQGRLLWVLVDNERLGDLRRVPDKALLGEARRLCGCVKDIGDCGCELPFLGRIGKRPCLDATRVSKILSEKGR